MTHLRWQPKNLASLDGNQNHIFIQGDIGNSALVGDIFSRFEPRAILNFAAESHVDRSIHHPEDFMQTNVIGTFRLLECAKGYWQSLNHQKQQDFRFLHISTDEVYGSLNPDAPAFTEKIGMSRIVRTVQAKHRPITLYTPTIKHTDCRRSQPIAPTTMGPCSSQKN